MADGDVPAAPGRGVIRAGDVVVGLALLMLLAFAPLARLVSAREPLAPALGPPLPVRSENLADHPLRGLPAGLPPGRLFRTPADLADLADRALGPAGQARLLGLLDPSRQSIPDTIGAVGSRVPYPYRYPVLEEILDAAPGGGATPEARALGAALIVLAGQPNDFGGSKYGNAAAAAFAVLERLRPGGDCAAQLDLLLLVASDVQPRDDPVRAETRQAEAVCPDDPTPAWILGQYLSQRAVLTVFINHGDPLPPNIQQRAASAFAGLQVLYPNSGPALTGAADAHLRLGIRLTERSPFRARQELRAAAAGYSRAIELHRDGATVGLARALIGLGEPARAAEILQAAGRGAQTSGPMLELTITAQEAAHDFAGAAATGRRLAARGASAYSDGTRLFPLPGIAEDSPYSAPPELLSPVGPQSAEAAAAALSTTLQPGEGGAGGTVDDLSFIPTYRPDYGSTIGTDPACAELSWRRATLLSGDPGGALADIPTPTAEQTFADTGQPVRPGARCELNSGMLRDIALAEAGRAVPGDRQHQKDVADARQNLWRWAGDLGRAERAIRAWQKTAGGAGALPMVRLGEVQFLQHRYSDAAATFGAAARQSRREDLHNDLDVDRALLDRGAALLRAGRSADGVAVLREVDEAAGYGVAYHLAGKNSEGQQRFGAVAYHARAQLADAERNAGDAAAAVEDYDAARELVPLFDIYARAPMRPERVDANEALAQLDLGRLDAAAASIERALRVDPANPVFLMTAGFVADRAGRTDLAARYDTQALASDPGAFPAANDLGVELTRLHRRDEAVTALRQAVGARPDYALGWFNLGVVHAQQGRLLPAEGAFARAFRLDPALADKERVVTIDGRIYRTGLDLSKPLPSRWSLARLPALGPAPAAGVLALLVLGLGLARTAATGSQLAPSWLEVFGDRLGNVLHLRAVGWALAATVVVFVVPALVRSPGAAFDLAVLGAGVVLLALAAVRARAMVARRAGMPARAESWPPGVVFALVTAPIAPWAPLPVTRTTGTAPRIYAAAPVLLAGVGVLLFAETALLAVPLARALGTAALIMVASVLVPVEPLDGGKLGKAGLVAGAGVLGAAALLALGVM